MSNNQEKHQAMVNEFIALANKFKDEGNQPQLISAAMMSAAAVYTTYTHAGNEGYLQDSGVDKLMNAFEKNVRQIQAIKKAQAEQANDKQVH